MGRDVWQIERFEQTESTNTLAVNFVHDAFLASGVVEGRVFVAKHQTAGRGQHGRMWNSPAGGLYLSAVVEGIPAAYRSKLALIAGAAVVRALEGVEELRVRWPNDLALRGKKVGGILCEAVAVGERWAGVIGIGVNVETEMGDVARELRPFATSLRAEGIQKSVEVVEASVLNTLRGYLERLKQHAAETWEEVLEAVRACDALHGKHLQLRVDDGVVEGYGCGIDEVGRLLMEGTFGVRAIEAGHLLAIDRRAIRA